jgi:hypothetical protein
VGGHSNEMSVRFPAMSMALPVAGVGPEPAIALCRLTTKDESSPLIGSVHICPRFPRWTSPKGTLMTDNFG